MEIADCIREIHFQTTQLLFDCLRCIKHMLSPEGHAFARNIPKIDVILYGLNYDHSFRADVFLWGLQLNGHLIAVL